MYPSVAGIKIGFQMPDGTQKHFCFSYCATVKVGQKHGICEEVLAGVNLCRVGLHGFVGFVHHFG